jgi:integrase
LSQTAVKVSRKTDAPTITRPRSASSVNRDVATLRAALNRAHRLGCVPSDIAWLETLRPTKNADGRRDVYLTRVQRLALIEHAVADLQLYLRGLSALPLRPGALAALKVKNFDARLGVLTIGKDKSGADRKIKLPAATAKFFSTLTIGKLPNAPLFARADGSEWNRFAWRDAIRDAVAASGLPVTTSAYALRHSTITDLVTGGLDLMTVAQVSGTSVAMIERHYAHLQSDRAAAALATLVL